MTVQECYTAIGGDYNDVLRRLVKEQTVKKHLIKFPDIDDVERLTDNIRKKDYITASVSAHALKGIAVNIGFPSLYEYADRLSGKLKNQAYDNLENDLKAITDEFSRISDIINEYKGSAID